MINEASIFLSTRLQKTYWKKNIHRIYFVFLVTILSFGILFVLPILYLVTDDYSDIDGNLGASLVRDIFALVGWELTLPVLLGAIIILFTLKGVIKFVSLSIVHIFRANLLLKLRSSLIENFRYINFSYFQSKNSGHFLNVSVDQTLKTIDSFYYFVQTFSEWRSGISGFDFCHNCNPTFWTNCSNSWFHYSLFV